MHVYLVERRSSGVQVWLHMGCRLKRQCMVGPCAAITWGRDLHIPQKLQRIFYVCSYEGLSSAQQSVLSLRKDRHAKRKFNRRLRYRHRAAQ